MNHPLVDERTDWIRRCALRLGRMRPELDGMQAALLADELYTQSHAVPPDRAAVELLGLGNGSRTARVTQ
jgi:hypothetical protein